MTTLNQSIKKDIEKLCKEFQLKFLVLFGSQASGKTHKKSDVDIGIYPENGVHDLAELEQKLASIFHTSHIDLVNLKEAGPLLQKEVALKGNILYEKEKASFSLFQMYAVSAYYDFQPYLKLREKVVQDWINKHSDG